MAIISRMILSVLILQIYANAAPNKVSKLEGVKELGGVDPTLDSDLREINDSPSQTTRQKRWWFDNNGYGFPTPVIYTSYNKRDEADNTAVFGVEDQLAQIHKRLQEIANVIKRPPSPPPPLQIPIFYPFLFVPGASCGCDDSSSTPPTTLTDSTATEMPDVTERQNFPVSGNETDDEEEFTRPISLEPIPPSRPLNRPPPAVEHGSVQGSVTDAPTTDLNDVIPIATNPPVNDEVPTIPNACDSAIISCCHQPRLDYSCFATQGCPDFTSYSGGRGRPCDSNIILRAVDRFQKFYNQKLG